LLLDECSRTADLPLKDAVKQMLHTLLPEQGVPPDDVVLLGVEV
jgi:hypothetical protein